MGLSQSLYKKAKKIIPGGTQLLSKRPEMILPDLWPAYYKKAKGCEVWDLDGNRYIDMSYMGVGTCILGYADDDVNDAVKKAINDSSVATLNCPEEVELAKVLCDIHQWADMARFARTGGEAMAMAVRIARAKTRKDMLLFCGYHGWHDWYLSANISDDKALDGHLLPGLNPRGVPRALRGTSIPFNYNNTEEFLSLIKRYKEDIGVVIMESIRNHYPKKDFMETVRKITKDLDIVLVFDEITAGWRMTTGGAHLLFNIEPDIAVFGKAISNGFPMAAVIGKKEVMEAANDTFISSTYWTDRVGPVAALAAINKMKKKNVSQYLEKTGKKVQEGWKRLAAKNDLDIEVAGIAPITHFDFNHKKPLVLKTLFAQLMLERGFLATTAFYASCAHKEIHIKKYLQATDEAFSFIAKAIKKDNPEKYLRGEVCHSGFRRLT